MRYFLFCCRLIDEGGDWDRRNRLKVYKGVYCMSIRQFKEAAALFLDTIATFTSYELMTYPTFVTYTVLCSVIALERPQLREKVLHLKGKGMCFHLPLKPLAILSQYLTVVFWFLFF